MEKNYKLMLAKCLNCREKVHCQMCERELEESLCAIIGVDKANVDLKCGAALVSMDPEYEDDVEETFEIAGFFIA